MSFNKVFWGLRNKAAVLSQLHDELAEVNAKWGLKRGDSVALTGAVHKSTKEYRSEQASLEAELRKQRAVIKGLETMIRNLANERDVLTKQLELIRKDSTESLSRKQTEISKLVAQITCFEKHPLKEGYVRLTTPKEVNSIVLNVQTQQGWIQIPLTEQQKDAFKFANEIAFKQNYKDQEMTKSFWKIWNQYKYLKNKLKCREY